jgi:hypothetical protein
MCSRVIMKIINKEREKIGASEFELARAEAVSADLFVRGRRVQSRISMSDSDDDSEGVVDRINYPTWPMVPTSTGSRGSSDDKITVAQALNSK